MTDGRISGASHAGSAVLNRRLRWSCVLTNAVRQQVESQALESRREMIEIQIKGEAFMRTYGHSWQLRTLPNHPQNEIHIEQWNSIGHPDRALSFNAAEVDFVICNSEQCEAAGLAAERSERAK